MLDEPPDNGFFCMLPWASLHVAMNGNAFPCCFSAGELPIGSTREQKLEEIWNGQPMRELRLNMLEGRPSRICTKCYEQEASGFCSLRNSANANFAHHSPFVAETQADGSLPRMNIAYLDVRFSNVCNFRCRTCGPEASTAWYKNVSDRSFSGVIRPKESVVELLEEIEPLLPHVEQVYFAGGEPTLMKEHYQVLERLLELGRSDVRLSYATNFSTLRFMHWDVLELWRQFPYVTLGASLDGSGARGEYLRKGQRWERVIENRRRLQTECPHVAFHLSSTLGILNSLHLPDFHEEWAALGLIRPGQVHINILHDPPHFRLTTLPPHMKDRVRARYQEHIAFLNGNDECESAIRGYSSAIRFMDSQDTSESLPEFRTIILDQDARRQESFADTFPELCELLEERKVALHELA